MYICRSACNFTCEQSLTAPHLRNYIYKCLLQTRSQYMITKNNIYDIESHSVYTIYTLLL